VLRVEPSGNHRAAHKSADEPWHSREVHSIVATGVLALARAETPAAL
jgi:hypothetical protein